MVALKPAERWGWQVHTPVTRRGRGHTWWCQAQAPLHSARPSAHTRPSRRRTPPACLLLPASPRGRAGPSWHSEGRLWAACRTLAPQVAGGRTEGASSGLDRTSAAWRRRWPEPGRRTGPGAGGEGPPGEAAPSPRDFGRRDLGRREQPAPRRQFPVCPGLQDFPGTRAAASYPSSARRAAWPGAARAVGDGARAGQRLCGGPVPSARPCVCTQDRGHEGAAPVCICSDSLSSGAGARPRRPSPGPARRPGRDTPSPRPGLLAPGPAGHRGRRQRAGLSARLAPGSRTRPARSSSSAD